MHWLALYMALLPNLELIEFTASRCELVLPVFRDGLGQESRGSDEAMHKILNNSASFLREQSADLALFESYLPLSNLRELRMRYRHTQLAFRMTEAQDMLLLPTLDIFRGFMVDFNTSLATHVPRPRLNLKHVYLEHSLIGSEGINDLLLCAPLLQTLRVLWGSALVGDSQHLNF